MKLEIRGLDVWGNAEEGFEVDGVYGVQATIEVADDADIVTELVNQDILYPGNYEFDDFGGSNVFGNVIDAKTGRPIVEVRQTKESE